MKLRFDKNSLRLRLKKSDMEKLRNDQSITETIPFPHGTFTYSLTIAPQQAAVSALVEDQSIKVILPPALALHWMNSNEVGIYHTIPADANNQLDLLIEKDFPCKEINEEDQQDYFTPDDVPVPPNLC